MKKKFLSILLTLVMLLGVFSPMGVLNVSAESIIEGTTGAGTEADPLIVDDMVELKKALAYNGTLYIVAKNFPTELISFGGTIELPYFEVVSKKVLTLKQNLEVKCLNGDTSSLFRVNDGADFTMIAENRQKIKYTYTVLELAGPNAKAALKGELYIETTTDDGKQHSYALVAHQGNILIDGAYSSGDYLRISSASLKNNAAVFKNGIVEGKVALTGTAFRLYPGSVGFLRDEEQDFTTVPNFGAAEVVREDLRVACIGGFNEQSPALEGTDATITAAEEKVILGMSKKYSFKTTNNTTWAEKFVYTPTGTIQVVDSTSNLIYSASDSDSGTFDKNVNLSIDLKDIIKTPGKYRIIEIIRLTRGGTDATKYVHVYPIEVVDFNKFLGQSPAMPAGKTSFNLGEIKKDSYPITFYAQPLSQSMIDEGYSSTAKLQVYDISGKYIYGEKAYCDKGQKISYDLNSLSSGTYYFVETVELRDKDNKVVKSAVNTFYIEWAPIGSIKTVNIDAKWSGTASAPTTTTKGVNIAGYKWEKYTGSTWVTLGASEKFAEGSTYRLSVALAAESGYVLADLYTVNISGFNATRTFGNDWYVSRSITKVVDRVYIYDIARPEVGAYPDFTGDEQSADTAFDKAEWFPCTENGTKTGDALTADDKFEEGYYRLEVTVKPPAGKNVVFEEQWQSVSTYDFGLLDINGDDPESWFYPDTTDHSVFTMWIVYHTDDAEGTYNLTLDGVTMKDGDYLAEGATAVSATKPFAGYAYYKNGVLTLDGYNDNSDELIFRERHLEINLIGENELKSIHNGHYYYGEYSAEDIEDPYCLTIGGSGSLEMMNNNANYVFAVNGDINFTGGKVRFDDDGFCGTYSTKNITVSGGAEVMFDAYCQGLSYGGFEELIVEDGTFTIFDGGSWNSKWINTDITFSKGYVYVYDYSNPVNPGISNPSFADAYKWDGVTDISKYSYVWIVSDEVCNHSYYVKYERADATCTTEGVKETFEICEECYLIVKKENGEILTGDEATEFFFDVVIPKGDHTYQFVEKHDATCVSAGAKSNYWLCTVCSGKFVTDEKIEISMHEFSKNIYLPKLAHQLTAVPAKSADCENDGNIAYWTCESCGKFFSDDAAAAEIGSADTVIPATGHTEEIIPGKAATETETGLTEGKKCSVCEKILVAQEEIPVIDAGHTHTYTDVVTAPTCKDKGFTTHTCACGDSYVDTYTDVTEDHIPEVIPGKAPTYQETGLTDGEKCSVCGKILKEQEVIDKLPTDHSHEYADTVVAPTCSEKGYTKHVCICGDTIIDTYVDPTGEHTPVVIPGKAATETETGLTEGKKCSVCNKILEEQEVIPVIVPGHTHDYVTVVINPTCTEKGYTTYTCTCGDTYTADETEAIGHIDADDDNKCDKCDVTINTEEPTTEEPSTEEPSTEEPTTEEPSTEEPSTEEPSTEEPSTEEPSTEEPSTEEPSTEELSTEEPSTEEPSTKEPSTEEPSTEEPSTEEPSTEEPSTEEPSTEEPSTEEPSTKHEHKYEESIINATCEENGYTVFTCKCGDTYNDNYVDATGHKPGDWEVVKNAEIGVEGKEARKCTLCGKVTEDRVIPAEILIGDVNNDGTITAADARLALRISAKLEIADEYTAKAADMTLDAVITAADARKILRKSAKLE